MEIRSTKSSSLMFHCAFRALILFLYSSSAQPSASQNDLDLLNGIGDYNSTVNLNQICRRFPLWLGNLRHGCTENSQWKPRRPWWWLGDSKETMEALMLAKNKDAIEECMKSEFLEFMKSWPDCDVEENKLHEICSISTLITDYQNHASHCDLVVIEGAFSLQEAFTVQSLGFCVRQLFPSEKRFFEKRPYFGHIGNATNYVASKHDCTYLAGFLQLFAPGVAAQVIHLARISRVAAQWMKINSSFPDPGTLGIRTAELLSYSYPSKLGVHVDDGSTYTVLVSLSNPEDYQGGEFIVEFADYKPEKLTALVFRSRITNHAVKEVTSGKRETVTAELWDSIDVPTGFSIPRPTQVDVEEYMKKFAGVEL